MFATLVATLALFAAAPPKNAAPLPLESRDIHRCFGVTPDGTSALVTKATVADEDGTDLDVGYATLGNKPPKPDFRARYGESPPKQKAIELLNAGLPAIAKHLVASKHLRCTEHRADKKGRFRIRSTKAVVIVDDKRRLVLKHRRKEHVLKKLKYLDAYDNEHVARIYSGPKADVLFIVLVDQFDADMGENWTSTVLPVRIPGTKRSK